MRHQTESINLRCCVGALRKLALSTLAVVVLAASTRAQTPRPLCNWVSWIPSMPAKPDDTVLFNILHAYEPADIYAAYGVDGLHSEGWTDQGQTIVVVDSYGSPTALQDLQTFSSAFGLPAPDLTTIYPDGQPTLNSADKLSWAVETSLDLQWAHAIAPDAKLVLIAANPSETTGVHGFPSMFKGIQYAIAHYAGSPISQSFGCAEPTFSSATPVQLARYEAIYQQAIAAGCTPLAAAGDFGTANPTKQPGDNGNVANAGSYYPYPTVSWPASSPSVTAVGGTWLQYHWRWNPQTNFAAYVAKGVVPNPFYPVIQAFLNWDTTDDRTEAVWREDWMVDASGHVAATGGGLSAIFPAPDWQANLPSSLTQGRRALPDISWNAAGDGGVQVYSTPAGGWLDVYGTSAATPQIAGLVALANQLRASLGKGPVGHLAPALFQLPADDFNDIVPQTFGSGPDAVTVGDNFRYGTTVPGFATTIGYDLTTGLGSPKAYGFVHDLGTVVP